MENSLKDATVRFKKAVERLPKKQQIQLLNAFAAQAEQINEQNSFPLPPTNYKPYQPRTDALAHLEYYFTDYLTYFGAEEDKVFQVDFRKFDLRLLNAVDSRLKYLRKDNKDAEKLADIIKTIKTKNTNEIKKIGAIDVKKYRRIVNTLSHRDPTEIVIS